MRTVSLDAPRKSPTSAPRVEKPKPAPAKPTKKVPTSLPKSTLANVEALRKYDTAEGTIIGDEVELIDRMLRANNPEAASAAITRVLLQATLNLVPFAEQHVRESGGQKGIYQFNSLTSMLLELLNTQRAMSDRGALALSMVEQIIRPTFTELATLLMGEFMQIKGNAKIVLSPQHYESLERRLDDSLQRLADKYTLMYNKVSEDTQKFLAG